MDIETPENLTSHTIFVEIGIPLGDAMNSIVAEFVDEIKEWECLHQ